MDRLLTILSILGLLSPSQCTELSNQFNGLKSVIAKESDLSSSETFDMKSCREQEIRERCKGYKYAMVSQKNGQVSCLNEFATFNIP